jgi:signal transduction histidine kinase
MWALWIKRDIRRMCGNLNIITGSDTNARLTTDTFDKDVTALAQSINTMLERNRHDILEKDRAEAALKRAVTNISHDLRTPLTAASGYLQMLKSDDLDNETRARYLDIMQGRLEVLSTLMNSLFEYARVTEGNAEFDIVNTNICNILRDALSENHLELNTRGFSVETHIPDTPDMCLCDVDALRRVLQNLIKNVCMHGKEYMRAGVSNSMIEIANKTDGIAELDAKRIFERFYTADASRTSKNTGLGLAIAKELTLRMGGKITARTEGEMLIMQVELRRSL